MPQNVKYWITNGQNPKNGGNSPKHNKIYKLSKFKDFFMCKSRK